MDKPISGPTTVSTSPVPDPAATSANPTAPTPATDLPQLARFRANCRLAWPLRRSGHYPRRLLAQVIASLVLLILGAFVLAGTPYSPVQHRGELTTVTVFPHIPVASWFQVSVENLALGGAAATMADSAPDATAQAVATPPGASPDMLGTRASVMSSEPPAPVPVGRPLFRYRLADGTEITYKWFPVPGWYLSLLLFAAYHALLVGWRGQTVGKRVVGLRVVGKGGRRIGYRRALARAVVYLPAAWLHLGVFWILVDRRCRGWHDLVAGTRVGEGCEGRLWHSPRRTPQRLRR